MCKTYHRKLVRRNEYLFQKKNISITGGKTESGIKDYIDLNLIKGFTRS